MAANRGADDTEAAETVVLRTADGTWYELRRVDGERAAALEQAAAAGTEDVAGFGHGGMHVISGEAFFMGGDHRHWKVFKISPDTQFPPKQTLSLAPPPSVRFRGGFPGESSGG